MERQASEAGGGEERMGGGGEQGRHRQEKRGVGVGEAETGKRRGGGDERLKGREV